MNIFIFKIPLRNLNIIISDHIFSKKNCYSENFHIFEKNYIYKYNHE